MHQPTPTSLVVRPAPSSDATQTAVVPPNVALSPSAAASFQIRVVHSSARLPSPRSTHMHPIPPPICRPCASQGIPSTQDGNDQFSIRRDRMQVTAVCTGDNRLPIGYGGVATISMIDWEGDQRLLPDQGTSVVTPMHRWSCPWG
jgi:hypothetical protein